MSAEVSAATLEKEKESLPRARKVAKAKVDVAMVEMTGVPEVSVSIGATQGVSTTTAEAVASKEIARATVGVADAAQETGLVN